MKERVVVICPGRGTYTRETLGYLRKFEGRIDDFLKDIDERRSELGEPTISELDAMDKFRPHVHTKGEHASPLIYACSYGDFATLDREKYEIAAILGNSMGWYITLALSEALDWAGAFEVIQTMGGMMREKTIGGQIIYPIVDEEWQMLPEKKALVEQKLKEVNERPDHEAYLSIRLGGYMVIGGNRPALSALLKELPQEDNYPFQLINHAAFHTPLLQETSRQAFEVLPSSLFNKPQYNMIDGRGKIWRPYSTDVAELYEYTLGHQVVEPYDFTQSLVVALKEFAPDRLVLLGPGGSLGGAIGQTLVAEKWNGILSKNHFKDLQATDPFLLSLGR